MNASHKQAFEAWAQGAAPREACGLLIRLGDGNDTVLMEANNIAAEEDRFILDPHSWAEAEGLGEVLAVIHSHVQEPPEPSQADLAACEATNLPWWIYSLATRSWGFLEPSGFTAPLIGREWRHGVLDCYALVRDYYRLEHGLHLPNYPRADKWWRKGQNLYLDHFAENGFQEVGLADIREGDALLMKIGSEVPNHAAIYLGNGNVLHHLHKQLSRRELLSEPFLRRVTHVLRYNGAS